MLSVDPDFYAIQGGKLFKDLNCTSQASSLLLPIDESVSALLTAKHAAMEEASSSQICSVDQVSLFIYVETIPTFSQFLNDRMLKACAKTRLQGGHAKESALPGRFKLILR